MKPCPCGQPRSRYNNTAYCFACDRLRCLADTGDATAASALAARIAAGVYRQPGRFRSPQEYLRALTEHLDKLCLAVGAQPPEKHNVWESV